MIKNNFRKSISILLAIAMICSVFVTITIPTQGAGSTQPTQYSSQYNSGQRGVICTTLDGTSASSYYTGSYVYDQLSGKSKDAIQSSLSTLMRSTHTYISSYDDCHNLADRTDCQNEDGSVSLIYTSYSATMSQWNGWNREHVWPKSLAGDTTTGGGADLHHIRPADAVVNSTRNNNKYGNVASGAKAVYGSNPASGCLGGYYADGYFEPLDNVKGDVARICLYVYVRWGDDWGATSITKVFPSVDVLLEWMELDPVDTWEMGRNEVVQDIQGNRNVFIDYPEYAWLIFGEEVPDDYVTPSNGKGNSEGGSSTSKPTEPATTEGKTEVKTEAVSDPTPDTPVNSGNVLATFELGENGSASHADGSEKTSYSETKNGYTLNITGGSKMYTGARDAKGNSCIKLGTGSAVGSFTFKVPNDVVGVVIHAAKYKANASVLTINGTNHTLTKSSDNGEYNEITIDTSTTKTVSVSTTSGGKRCMINTIKFLGAKVEDTEEQTTKVTTEATTEAPTEKPTDTTAEVKTENITEPTTEAPGETVESGYNLVTSVSELKAGDKIIIVAVGNDFALSTTQNNNNRGQVAITKSGNLAEINDSVQIITLEVGDGGTFAFNVGNGYLYAASSGSNYLKTQSTNNANGLWKIEISSEGVATIKAQGSNSRNELKYNSTSSLFSCYGSGNTQKAVAIYKLYEKPASEPEPESPKITDYSVTLGGGTTINVKCTVSAEWLAANPDATLSFRNEFGTTPLEVKVGEHAYSVTLTPKEIEKELYFVVSDGTNETLTRVSYSIYAEAANKIEGYEDLKNLLDAIDNYTSAANRPTDVTGYASESFNGVDDWKPEVTGNILTDIKVNLGQQITAKVTVDTARNYAGYKVTVKLGEVELVKDADFISYITSNGELVVKGLAPTHLDDELTVTVYNEGVAVSSASFKLNSYLKYIYTQSSTTDYYKNMAAVTYQYGVAAEAYAAAQEKN